MNSAARRSVTAATYEHVHETKANSKAISKATPLGALKQTLEPRAPEVNANAETSS